MIIVGLMVSKYDSTKKSVRLKKIHRVECYVGDVKLLYSDPI